MMWVAWMHECWLGAYGCIRTFDSLLTWAVTGEKMIDHLKNWLEPAKLLAVQHCWEPGQEAEIAAGMLDVFHKLPNKTKELLETQAKSPVCAQLTCLASFAMPVCLSCWCVTNSSAPSIRLAHPVQDKPGLVVITIELENALPQLPGITQPSKVS